jgi:5-methylcytosine-specific restriction protein A
MAEEWIDLSADPGHVARERARARDLRASDWWRQQVAAGRCHYCGAAAPPEALTMDHVIPVSRGGRSVKGNVVPACTACNRAKRFLTPAEQTLAELNAPRRHPLTGGGDIVTRGEQALVIDPGSGAAALDRIRAEKLTLHSVLLTHDTADAAVICAVLRTATGGLVMGPAACAAYPLDRELADQDTLCTPVVTFTVAEAPDGAIRLTADVLQASWPDVTRT